MNTHNICFTIYLSCGLLHVEAGLSLSVVQQQQGKYDEALASENDNSGRL